MPEQKPKKKYRQKKQGSEKKSAPAAAVACHIMPTYIDFGTSNGRGEGLRM